MGKKGIDTKVLNFVSRQEWDAQPPTSTETLPLPVEQVLFTFTSTKCCNSREECIERVLSIQDDHMKNKSMPDIAYSFLLGGDAGIYEGRGWHNQPTLTDDKSIKPEFAGKSIVIAYIGDFGDDNFPSKPLLKIKDELVRFGIKNNFIKDEFKDPWMWEPVAKFDEESYQHLMTVYLARKEATKELSPASPN